VKRLLPLLALAALVAVPAAAAGRQAPPTMHTGQLVVAFGYEVDVARAIAKQLHLKPVWVYSPWNSLFAPGAKKFDISFQEATITAQRKKTVDFTTSYLNANQGVLLSPKAKVPHSLADLRELQTCAQTNTTGLQYISDQLKPMHKPLTFPTTTAAYQAVQIGRCEAFILDVPLVSLEKKQNPKKFGAVAGQIVTHEQYGAVLQKNSKLTMTVDAVLKKLTKNGTVGKLQKKWFNLNFAKIPVLK
jgi:polar amino acid transport system substrate-binding protein